MDARRQSSARGILVGILVVGSFSWLLSQRYISSKLEIGPETTFVTGPLTSDGKIDYPAALHQRLSSGVLPDDNAAVLIDRAFGPGAIPRELRSQYFEWIGTDPLPDEGPYVVTQSALIQQNLNGVDDAGDKNDQLMNEFVQAQRKGWRDEAHPVVLQWLQANAVPLDLIEQATHRRKYYSPVVTHSGMIAAESTIQNLREAVRLLSTRAMWRLGSNNVEGAWSDLLACHRLARLAGKRSPSMLAFMVAAAMNSVAVGGDAALIEHVMSAEQARQCIADFEQLPPFGSIVDVMNEGNRLVSLDATIQTSSQAQLDVNTMLRRTNRMFDELIATMKLENPAKRRQAYKEIDKDFKTRVVKSRQPLRQIAGFLSRSAATESVSDALLGLLVPAYEQADAMQMRMRIHDDLVRIGFSLAAYHAEHQNYPQSLDELVPSLLKSVPIDPYTEKPLIYKVQDDGFLIYSVGKNLRDDGGQTQGLNQEDDVCLKVPVSLD